LEGTAEDEDRVVEAEAGAAESEAGVFTAPDDLSSRTIASTMALSFESSINNFSMFRHCEEGALPDEAIS